MTKKEKTDLTGEVLVILNGKPVITADNLIAARKRLLNQNPNLKEALVDMGPKEFDRNLLEGLISQKVVDEYVAVQKINQTPAYKAELKDLCEAMERMLNTKYFDEMKRVTISEDEVRDFYEANKDTLPNLMISQGAKQESKYVPYEQVKDSIKQELEHNKRVELVQKEIDDLRKEYAVEVNEDYFFCSNNN